MGDDPLQDRAEYWATQYQTVVASLVLKALDESVSEVPDYRADNRSRPATLLAEAAVADTTRRILGGATPDGVYRAYCQYGTGFNINGESFDSIWIDDVEELPKVPEDRVWSNLI